MILLTGATGYIGGRLLPVLEASGRPLRCLARRPEHLRARAHPTTEIVTGDVLSGEGLETALQGIRVAYYLVHALGSAGSFVEEDRRAAENFGSAAAKAGIARIIYLGGLGDESMGLSDHLRSRQETGRILRESGIPVLELRASIVIGSGSLSFEMVRALVERLPVMITPRWVHTVAQPIAVEDVIAYLVAAADLPLGGSEIFEIGGADQVSYGEIMKEYAQQRGLKRVMISVPILTPRLSGLWLGLVTPVYARVGRQLVQGLRNPTVVRDHRAALAFNISPLGLRAAINRALRNEDEMFARTRWSDALSSSGIRRSRGGVRFGARIIDSRAVEISRPAATVFAPLRRIGGGTGWYFANWLWRLRGALDLLAGGVGLRRGRRDPEVPLVGDTLDFWRVEVFEPDRRLRLAAEMKLPGRAWLEFEVEPVVRPGEAMEDGVLAARCLLRQTAIFDPVGLGGLVYWYALFPIHKAIFAGMLRRIAEIARSTGGPG
jgi:uncharacterized protein YbjT (DUF2867 family)